MIEAGIVLIAVGAASLYHGAHQIRFNYERQSRWWDVMFFGGGCLVSA